MVAIDDEEAALGVASGMEAPKATGGHSTAEPGECTAVQQQQQAMA